jgi:protein SCO1/2
LGCSDSAFKQRIEASRALKLNVVPKVKEGIPFFEKVSLIPTWEVSEKSKLAKIEGVKLKNQNGVTIDDQFFTKSPTLVVFFFSSCSAFCPTMIGNFKKLADKLKDFKDIQYLAVSVDPARDTIEKMAKYKKKFVSSDDKNWHFAVASEPQLKHLADNIFSIEIYKDENSDRIIHSERVFLVDSTGYLRGVFNSTRVDLSEQARATLAKLQ